MVNYDIRDEITRNRIRMWEIAQRMGITDSHLSRKFRKELTDETKAKIRGIIKDIKSAEADNAEPQPC